MDSVVKLNRKLGVGGRGVVYAGFDQAKGQFVAVKEMAYMEPSMAGEEDTELAEILSELACMREAQHPNLVQYYGARRSAVGVQIIMEYVSGGSLDYVLKRCGPLREAVARAYTRDVLEALQYLHEVMHVCHRDVKPANILVTPEGRCKLTDFGVAKHVEETQQNQQQQLSNSSEERGKQRKNSGMRQGYLQTAVGTPWYMAPEVINGGIDDDDEEDQEEEEAAKSHNEDNGAVEHVKNEIWGDWEEQVPPPHIEDSSKNRSNEGSNSPTTSDPDASSRQPLYASKSYYNPLKRIIRKGRLTRGPVGYTTRADIWSVGVTVYEMLTGTRPFAADLHNPSAVMFRISNCATTPPRLPLELNVSPTLQNFLDLCFVYDKDLRATARELLGHPWLRGASQEMSETTREPLIRRLSGSHSSKESISAQAHPHIERRTISPPTQQQPQLSEHHSVFAGVPLLDAIDLPAYPTVSTREISRSTSSSNTNHNHNNSNKEACRTTCGQRSPYSPQRLSSAGMCCSFPAPPTSSTEALWMCPHEKTEASSRYAAARQRIGHVRRTVPRSPAVPPHSGNIGSASGDGIRTRHGAFVDSLSPQ